jgi:hypothetical protein
MFEERWTSKTPKFSFQDLNRSTISYVAMEICDVIAEGKLVTSQQKSEPHKKSQKEESRPFTMHLTSCTKTKGTRHWTGWCLPTRRLVDLLQKQTKQKILIGARHEFRKTTKKKATTTNDMSFFVVSRN